jgi:hypothetical protein
MLPGQQEFSARELEENVSKNVFPHLIIFGGPLYYRKWPIGNLDKPGTSGLVCRDITLIFELNLAPVFLSKN